MNKEQVLYLFNRRELRHEDGSKVRNLADALTFVTPEKAPRKKATPKKKK